MENKLIWRWIYHIAFTGFVALGIYRLLNDPKGLDPLYPLYLLLFLSFLKNPSDKKSKFWIISTLAMVLVGILTSYFSNQIGQGKINLNLPETLVPTTLVLVFLVILIALIFNLSKSFLFRPSQFRKLAKKYNLKYDKGSVFSNETILGRNVLTGIINSKNIEVYDAIDTLGYPIGIGAIAKRMTIVSVDGNKNQYVGKVTGFYPINKLEQILKSL